MKQLEYFFLGIFAAVGALVAEVIFLYVVPGFFPSIVAIETLNIYYFILMAAVVEEAFKYSALAFRQKEITDLKNLTAKIIFVGLGFSMAEILLNFWKIGFDFSLFPVLSALEIFFIHLLTTAISGFLIVRIKNKCKPLPIILIASVLHFAFNAMVNFDINDSLILIFLAGLFVINLALFFNLKRKNLLITNS